MIDFCHFFLQYYIYFKNIFVVDREARDGGPVAQHAGPVGDWPQQPQVHQEAGARPVRGGVGGRLEQHHTRRHQDPEARYISNFGFQQHLRLIKTKFL